MTTPHEPGRVRSVSVLSAAGTVTWLAERAVIGALLCRPERIVEMSTWLQAQDFADPQHQGLFATIEGLHAARELAPIATRFTASSDLDNATQQTVRQNILAVWDALATHRFTTVAYRSSEIMVGLYQAGAGIGPELYNRYGRIVLEMSVRRQVDRWGVRMAQAARAEPHAGGDITILQGTRAAMVEDLSDLLVRVRRSHGELVGRIASPIEMPVVTVTALLHPKLVERSEEQVIQAVLTDPQWSSLVERLRPEDFTASTAHANTWRAIQAVASRGEPLDPILVAWQAEAFAIDPRTGNPAPDRQALPATKLVSMRTEPVGDVRRALSTVARSALAHHARHAQREIQQAATTRDTSVEATMDKANTVGATLEQHAKRLVGVDRQPESAISRALAGERATVPTQTGAETRSRTR